MHMKSIIGDISNLFGIFLSLRLEMLFTKYKPQMAEGDVLPDLGNLKKAGVRKLYKES